MYIPVVVAGQHDQELQRPLHQHAQPAAPSRRGEQQERRRQLRDERGADAQPEKEGWQLMRPPTFRCGDALRGEVVLQRSPAAPVVSDV